MLTASIKSSSFASRRPWPRFPVPLSNPCPTNAPRRTLAFHGPTSSPLHRVRPPEYIFMYPLTLSASPLPPFAKSRCFRPKPSTALANIRHHWLETFHRKRCPVSQAGSHPPDYPFPVRIPVFPKKKPISISEPDNHRTIAVSSKPVSWRTGTPG